MTTTNPTLGRRLPSVRKLWLNVHLWLGLTAGFVLSLIGLSGSFIVVYDQALAMEVGHHLFDVAGPPPHRSAVDEWIANARRTYNDIGHVDFVMGPGFSHGGKNVVNLGITDASGKFLIVTADPSNGATLGRFDWFNTYAASILGFHAQISNSFRGGHEIVAWVGVAMLVSMVTGLYLWWPRNGNWYAALTLKQGARGRRRLLDLHNILAVYFYVPLFIIGFTGVYFIKPHWIDPVISLASVERTPDPAALAGVSKPGACEVRTTPGQAADVAQARFPTATLAMLVIPRDNGPYQVHLAPLNNLNVKGQTQVYVDRECPIILTAIDGEVRTGMETFKAAVHPLHGNLMLGTFGAVIVFLAGLLLPFSYATGVLLWLDKRKSRRRIV